MPAPVVACRGHPRLYFRPKANQDVDDRDKPGHDELPGQPCPPPSLLSPPRPFRKCRRSTAYGWRVRPPASATPGGPTFCSLCSMPAPRYPACLRARNARRPQSTGAATGSRGRAARGRSSSIRATPTPSPANRDGRQPSSRPRSPPKPRGASQMRYFWLQPVSSANRSTRRNSKPSWIASPATQALPAGRRPPRRS